MRNTQVKCQKGKLQLQKVSVDKRTWRMMSIK